MMLNTFIAIAQDYPWEEAARRRARHDVIVRREPVGVVAGIVPWNVPQFVTMSKLAPALLAGCSIVVKPAPETPLDAYLMAELLDEAGIPKGVVSVLPAGREVGEHLVRHPGRRQGRVHRLDRRRSPHRGDLRRAAEARAASSSAASRPRSCSTTPTSQTTMEGLKLRVAHEQRPGVRRADPHPRQPQRYDEVVDALGAMVGVDAASATPSDPATEIGPLVAQRQQERVEKYIALGQEEGARVVVGGSGRPTASTRAGTCSPPSSPTRPTTCASPARRSSARC